MAESGLDSLRQRRAVRVVWKAFELRPGGVFPGTTEEEARYRAMIEEKHIPMWALASERFGLEMAEGPWGVDSRPALEGAYFARAQGLEEAYHQACYRTHWQEARRLDDPGTLVAIAQAVGLDTEAFHRSQAERVYREQVDADLALARAFGIQAIPAFVFGERYLVSGAQTPDVLEEVVDRCIAEGLVV
jgi:predicted DsbA family dithiol-disulfide isomerase